MTTEARKALEVRCWHFLDADNKKARTTVIAAREFADFVEQEAVFLASKGTRRVGCCMGTPDPGPWTAGVDDSADQYMIHRMHSARSMLRNDISDEDLVKVCRISVGLDQRTRLGYHIQCCVLHLAASRLELLALKRDPYPYTTWRARLHMAWEVWKGRANAIRFKDCQS